MNLYKDEQNFEFKFRGSIEMMDVKEAAVCFGERAIHRLCFSEKRSEFIMNRDINCLAVYKDFCYFGQSRVTLINLNSAVSRPRGS